MLTEKGKEWVKTITAILNEERSTNCFTGINYDLVHPLSQKSAEYWLRAVCEEIENRASHKNRDYILSNAGLAFYDIKNEFLEDKNLNEK